MAKNFDEQLELLHLNDKTNGSFENKEMIKQEQIILNNLIDKIDDSIFECNYLIDHFNTPSMPANPDADEHNDWKYKSSTTSNFLDKKNCLVLARSNPYSARMIMCQNDEFVEEVFIGKMDVFDSDANTLVYDWRSNYGKIYNSSKGKKIFPFEGYNYTFDLKNVVQIKNGVVEKVTDEIDSLDDFLKSKLNKSNNNKFVDIIETIQSNQNEIITEDLKHNVLVQGVAGSGKSVIILHRLSYLLYNYKIDPRNILYIAPSLEFKNRIYELQKELEVSNINVFTMNEYLKDKFNALTIDYKISDVIDDNDEEYNFYENINSKKYLNNVINEYDLIINSKLSKIIDDYKIAVDNSKKCNLVIKSCYDFISAERDKIEESYSLLQNVKKNIKKLFNYADNDDEFTNFSHINYDELMNEISEKFEELKKQNEINKKEDDSKELEELKESIDSTVSFINSLIDKYDVNFIHLLLNEDIYNFFSRVEEELNNLNVKKEIIIDVIESNNKLLATFKLKGIDEKNDIYISRSEENIENKNKLFVILEEIDYFGKILEIKNDLIDKIDKYNESKKSKISLICVDDRRLKEYDIFIKNLFVFIKFAKKNYYYIDLENKYKKLFDEIILLVNKRVDFESLKNFNQDLAKFIYDDMKYIMENLNFEKKNNYDICLNNLRNILNPDGIVDFYKLYLDNHFGKKIFQNKKKIVANRSDITVMLRLFTYYGHVPVSKFQYIYIDEAQDFWNCELMLPIDLDYNCYINYYGDINQRIKVNSPKRKNWDSLLESFNSLSYHSLKENYRNSYEVVEFCNKFINFKMSPVGNYISDVKKLTSKNLEDLLKINDHDIEYVFITDNEYISNYLKEHDFISYSIIESKGLEFDDVCFIDDGNTVINEKYVACTRALKNLLVINFIG